MMRLKLLFRHIRLTELTPTFSTGLNKAIVEATRYGILGAMIVLILLAGISVVFPLHLDIPYSQVLLARDSTVIHAFLSADDKWRMKTELHEISPTLRRALVHKEDKWFYWHCGVNPAALLRALFNNLREQRITSGASTITMQVARMLEQRRHTARERTVWRKLVELVRALQLEARFSKDEILQLYLNLAPYGSNIEGVKSASLLYFGQAPERLSIAQATTLAIIPNRPTSLRLDASNTRIAEERNKWLRRFQAEHIFSQQEIADALREPLAIKRTDAPALAPHFALRVRALFPQMPIIHTSLDLSKQTTVAALTTNKLRRLALRGIHNAAVIVIDNATREVLAYIGSPDFQDKAHFGEVDGVKAVRSPGSALKPLVYGLAIDKGLITPKTILNDVPINIDGYTPENFDRRFVGVVSAEQALIMSLNIPAVKLLDAVSIKSVIETLKQVGFEQIRRDESRLGLSLVLGGCGVRLEEMAQLYCAFANEGVAAPLMFTRHHAVHQHTQSNKPQTPSAINAPQTAQQHEERWQTRRILSPAAAFMLSEILTQLSRPDVPNRYVSFTRLPKVAWKTGTSYGRRDAWSIGYNKRYTVGVWVGNFSGAGVPELVGAEIATPLLFEIFNAIDYNNTNDWFTPPAQGLDFRLVCAESGLPPDDCCTNQVTDYYIPSVSTNKRCDHLKQAFVSLDESVSYCPDCLPPAGQYKVKRYPNLAPELLTLYRHEHYDIETVPTHNSRCSRLQQSAGKPPVITSLVDRKEYLLERESARQIQVQYPATGGASTTRRPEDPQLLLACHAAVGVKTVYWYVNDRFLAAAEPQHRVFFTPEAGTIKISCSDDQGRTSHIIITVRFY
jgi:penicillin-binding protein 1C